MNRKTAINRFENLLGNSKLDHWIAFDLLYTLSITSKFSNTQHHLVVKATTISLSAQKQNFNVSVVPKPSILAIKLPRSQELS